MSEIVVHGVPGSPYFRSAMLGLEEKGIAYTKAFMPFGTMRSAESLQRHPFGRIPVLDHGDFRLYETQAILRYIDSLAPEQSPLQPRDTRAAARMNQIVGIIDCYVFPQISVKVSAERLMSQAFWGRPTNEEAVAKAVPDARICIQELARLKGKATFLTGDRVSIADLMLAPHMAFFRATPEGQMLLQGTGLDEWIEHMSARPSMQATERERLMQAA